MNPKQFEISKRSRYSWTNLHNHNYVVCRKCTTPLLPEEYAGAIGDESKIIAARLPDRCGECEARKKLKKEEKKEAKLAKSTNVEPVETEAIQEEDFVK